MSDVPKISTWPTWKKRNCPQMYRVKDTTLGYVDTIGPTLGHYGFEHTSEERTPEQTPRQQLDFILEGSDAQEVVYHVWKHNQGYMERIEVYYK